MPCIRRRRRSSKPSPSRWPPHFRLWSPTEPGCLGRTDNGTQIAVNRTAGSNASNGDIPVIRGPQVEEVARDGTRIDVSARLRRHLSPDAWTVGQPRAPTAALVPDPSIPPQSAESVPSREARGPPDLVSAGRGGGRAPSRQRTSWHSGRSRHRSKPGYGGLPTRCPKPGRDVGSRQADLNLSRSARSGRKIPQPTPGSPASYVPWSASHTRKGFSSH